MKNETSIPIIDCDIHPQPSEEFPLQPFIDEKFHQAVAQGQGSQPGAGYANPFGVNRRDAECKNPQHVARDLFDRYNIVYGVLQPGGLHVSLTHNIDVGTALARAWNEWQIANFLDADERFLGSVCINTNDPAEGREGDSPRRAASADGAGYCVRREYSSLRASLLLSHLRSVPEMKTAVRHASGL
jgi:predicted TIM-barrel fold metal-dependent hydrolase